MAHIYVFVETVIHSLKLTCSHLKMDNWKTSFLLEWPIFRGYVSFGECRAFLPIRFDHPFKKYHGFHPFGSGICLGSALSMVQVLCQKGWCRSKC